MASAQLQLIYTDHAWKLDRRTVQIGRAGVAQARAALAAATTDPVAATDEPTDIPESITATAGDTRSSVEPSEPGENRTRKQPSEPGIDHIAGHRAAA